MQISERQLRRIVREEFGRKALVEAAPAPKLPAASDLANAKMTGDVLTWQDGSYGYSWNTKTNEILTNATGQPKDKLTVKVQPGKVSAKTGQVPYDAIQAQGRLVKDNLGALSGGQKLGCNLAAFESSVTEKLGSIAKMGVAAGFYAQILVGSAMPIQPDSIIQAGNKLAQMGEGGSMRLSTVIDYAAGNANEFVGSFLVLIGTFAKGVQQARAGFVGGPNKCSFGAYAQAVVSAYTNAFSAAGTALQQGYSNLGRFLSQIAAALPTILAAVGIAAGPLLAALKFMVMMPFNNLMTLGNLIGQALMAAGQAQQVVGQGNVAVGQALVKATSESVRRRALDNLIFEVCSIAYAREILDQNVRPENRHHILRVI